MPRKAGFFALHTQSLACLLAASASLSCQPQASEPAPLSAASVPAAGTVAGASRGIEQGYIDHSVAAGDDFFAYANGTWVKTVEIPSDRSSWGVFGELRQQTNLRLQELLDQAAVAQSPPGSEPRMVGDYYATFLDAASIEARGITPLVPLLAPVTALKNKRDLASALGAALRADVDPLNNTQLHTDRLFGLWVSPGFESPSVNEAYLLQGGLGLPDREYYLSAEPRMADIRAKYVAHVVAVLQLAGLSGAEARAARILALETKMASTHVSRADSMLVRKANNPWPRAEFDKRAPGLDWTAFFHAAGLDAPSRLIVWHPTATRGLAALVASEPLEAWTDWLAFHSIDRRGALLPKAFVDEQFSFYEKTLSGTPQIQARKERAVDLTSEALGDAVGQLYVKKYFPSESKAALQAMVKNIVTAFSLRIDGLAWMAPATKARAKAKLSTLYVGVGYPDHWIDYAGLEIVPGDAVGNAERVELFEYRRSLSKVGRPVERTEWQMAPQTVNALNLPIQNALNFPAAILVPPFFDPELASAVNYGAVGAIIGHEISHSFDDQGAEFDENGKLEDWWTQQDRSHFEAAGARLVAQYDAYQPFSDLHLNGKLTLSENIADLAGLGAAHDAWLASLGGAATPELDGLSGEQQFFLAFAQAWRSKLREEVLRRRVITDGHAPAEYRADTVRNVDAWYSAFDVKPGQRLHLPAEGRVRVW